MDDLWKQVGNRCLELALELLQNNAVPTGATVETAGKLVAMAVAIDDLSLRWEAQTRYGAAVFRAQPLGRRAGES